MMGRGVCHADDFGLEYLPVNRRQEQKYRQGEFLCYPSYCIYAYACSIKPTSRGYVLVRKCLRYRPKEERPWPRLSRFALKLLLNMRDRESQT